ncbi:hypothetical protein RJ640_015513 [Escallonia rubra]|uniref:Phospholipid/glycerol acyltransferase domain-containing protein n=1 Tax=Escallonia rubra TaxID=112253 RepID=A0AA88RTP4_9ASTE|nr:hypothetical protein RJ640_015513 [Escallonia rubra]
MAAMPITVKTIIYLSKFLLRSLNHMEDLQKNASSTNDSQSKLRKYASLNRTSEELPRSTIVFHVEGALLRSSSVFPYFMLVAFEAGGILRALVLLFLYPFVCLVSRELALKIMVFLCFFGIKKESFRIGTSVLPKFFLEDVGHEGFEVVMKCGKKVGVSDLPSVMVEGFLKEYLGVDAVIGRKIKVACGYFTGLMEAKTGSSVLNSGKELDFHLIGFGCSGMFPHEHIFSHCKDVFLVNEAEKRKWTVLPRNKYPKPLIFHDGRLAFRPTSVDTLVMFLWLPLGLFLAIIRLIATITLPYKLSLPLLAFTGMRGRVARSKLVASVEVEEKPTRKVYVCNHRTLLDPVFVRIALMRPVAAVTYSLSRVSELISPIRTTRLLRDKDKDSKMMEKLLRHSDLVVCPEGTTCREPYLLRFSPLFAELSDEIVPLAIDVHVNVFYGTTASGLKCLDPVFFLLNPYPAYYIKILETLPISYTCSNGGKSSIEVANHVQTEIARALGFECTSLTRKDKYMILAGVEGTV